MAYICQLFIIQTNIEFTSICCNVYDIYEKYPFTYSNFRSYMPNISNIDKKRPAKSYFAATILAEVKFTSHNAAVHTGIETED